MTRRYLWPALLLVACETSEPIDELGGQSGSLKNELPQPEDVSTIDYERAAAEAVALALSADLVAPWRGHVDLLTRTDGECPTLFIGSPEQAMTDDEEALSWAGSCSSGALDFGGWMSWNMEVDAEGSSATRQASGDARMFDDGQLALEFDGDASDAVTWQPDGGFSYSSTLDGQFSGPLVYGADSSVPGGFRGAAELAYDADGTLHVDANLFLFGDPLVERFDAVAIDLDFEPDPENGCADEPVGYIGLRGTDGYWFDIYFMPRFAADDPTAEAQAYPYELIGDPICDGCGNLFVRNVAVDEPQLVCPDLDPIRSALSAPSVDEYILTLHDLPWEGE